MKCDKWYGGKMAEPSIQDMKSADIKGGVLLLMELATKTIHYYTIQMQSLIWFSHIYQVSLRKKSF